MKKVDIDEDYKIDEFLKCEDAVVSSNLDPQKLAGEILKTKTPKTFSFKLIRFGLPLAACMAVFFGLVIHRSDHISKESTGRDVAQVPPSTTANSDLLPEEIAMIDEWLLATPIPMDFSSVNYDSSYEFLVSLETIPLP